ncbi:MAG: complex I subunit 1 family protein [Gemmataceae bacterium]
MVIDYSWTNWSAFVITLLLIGAVMGGVQGTCAYLILAERKISAWAQDRIGPNRVGREFGIPFGLLQPIADGVKFLLKEQVIPNHVDKLFYILGPMVAVATATLAIAVVPIGPTTPAPTLLDRRSDTLLAQTARPLAPVEREALLKKLAGRGELFTDDARGVIWPATETERFFALAADRAWAEKKGEKSYEERAKEYNGTLQFVIAPNIDIGVVFVFAVGSLAAYAIVLGGWSSNNKYSLLGSLRSSAQLISYEIPMGMSVLGIFLLTGSLNLERIIGHQAANGWNFIYQPLALLLFSTSIFAECNRLPFDLPEAEQELVGGYHTEYSGMKFALFFLGEYTHMITTSFLVVALFFGGWHLPWITGPNTGGVADMIVKLAVFGGKMILYIIFYMLIRWTIPRFRFDQLMGLTWKVLMPLALLNVVACVVVQHYQLPVILLLPVTLAILIGGTAVSLLMPRSVARTQVVLHGHPVTGTSRMVAN